MFDLKRILSGVGLLLMVLAVWAVIVGGRNALDYVAAVAKQTRDAIAQYTVTNRVESDVLARRLEHQKKEEKKLARQWAEAQHHEARTEQQLRAIEARRVRAQRIAENAKRLLCRDDRAFDLDGLLVSRAQLQEELKRQSKMLRMLESKRQLLQKEKSMWHQHAERLERAMVESRRTLQQCERTLKELGIKLTETELAARRSDGVLLPASLAKLAEDEQRLLAKLSLEADGQAAKDVAQAVVLEPSELEKRLAAGVCPNKPRRANGEEEIAAALSDGIGDAD